MTTGAEVLAALRTVALRKVEAAGVEFYVRGLTGAERRLLIERARANDPLQAFELVGLAACDATAAPLFTQEQAAELANVDGAAVEKVAEAIIEASGLRPDAQEQAAKN